MKKATILMTIMALALFTGCGNTSTDINNINCGDGGCGDVIVGDGNTLHQGEDTGVTPSTEFDIRNYDRTLSQGECNDLGFFYCTVVNECLPQPLNTGTCPNL